MNLRINISDRRKSETTLSLGEEIRQLRRARAITLSKLASKVKKTPGFISQIERGIAKPSVKTLQDISLALNVPVGWFFVDDNANASSAERHLDVVKASKRRQLRYSELKGSSQLSFEDCLLSPHLKGNMVAGFTKFGPGGTWGDEMVAFDSETFIYIASGTFILEFPDRRYVLQEGDSAQYKAGALHTGYCPPGEAATLIWVCSPVLLHVTSQNRGRSPKSANKRRRRTRR
jgi:transcriptional regulator with XRE-family HTH domain